jgi:hypothetical protein
MTSCGPGCAASAKLLALALERWSSLAEDERLQPLLMPFVGFLDVADQTSNQQITSTNSLTRLPPQSHSRLLSCARSLSSALRPAACAAKSVAMIHAAAVQVSSTNDAAAQVGPTAEGGDPIHSNSAVPGFDRMSAARFRDVNLQLEPSDAKRRQY